MPNTHLAEARLTRWKQRWEVVDPDIRCLVCGGTQSLFGPHGSFNRHHALDCPMRSDLPQSPKQDLVKILRSLTEGD
jgi:hypothetical protein